MCVCPVEIQYVVLTLDDEVSFIVVIAYTLNVCSPDRVILGQSIEAICDLGPDHITRGDHGHSLHISSFGYGAVPT